MGCAMKRQDTAAKNWVPNVEPAHAAPARPAPTVELVSGKVLDNLWGGVGVAVALGAIYALLRIGAANLGMMQLPSWQHAAWAGLVFSLVGLFAFGALTAWRASLDERERQGDINAMAARIADDDEYIDTLEAKIAAMELERANLIDDLAETRRSLHQAMGQASARYRQPDEDVEPEAERNAKFLLQLAYRDKWRGRDYIVKTYDNWTPTMWTEARNLLELAGIVRTVGRETELLKSDYSSAVVALAAYCHNDQ